MSDKPDSMNRVEFKKRVAEFRQDLREALYRNGELEAEGIDIARNEYLIRVIRNG